MEIITQDKFKNDESELADFARALSHPARIAIVKLLSVEGSCTCGAIVNVLPLSQATVSQHLAILLKAGLLCCNNTGNKSLYCIEWNKLERVFFLFGRLNGKTMCNRPKRNCC